MRRAAGRWIRRTHGFTFIELLVILSILGIGVYFASVGTAGQNAYYGLRGDVERLVSALQRACIQSASRGDMLLPSNAPITAGVTFYQSQMGPRFQVVNGAPSFINWFDDLPVNTEALPAPAPGLAGLNARLQTASRALRTDNVLTRAYVPLAAVVPLRDGATFRYRSGRMDIYQPNGSVGGAFVAALNGDFTMLPSPLGIGNPVAWTFDVVNPAAGWVRIRVLSGGFVEASGVNPLANAAPTNVSGGVF